MDGHYYPPVSCRFSCVLFMKSYYFLSGLPRSGSTLLKSLLNQNPNIHCSPISPALELMYRNKDWIERTEMQLSLDQKNTFLSNIMDNIYKNYDEEIIIDSCRAWTSHEDLIRKYINPTPKIICTVRNVTEILTSFIVLLESNKSKSFIDQKIVGEITTKKRCETLMKEGLGRSLQSLKMGKNVILVEYNDLISQPHNTLNKIYDYLGVKKYSHDLNNIVNHHQEIDTTWGIDNMHRVRSKLEKISHNPYDVLGEELVMKYSGMEFRRKPKMFLL